jgi:hypothetical protein
MLKGRHLTAIFFFLFLFQIIRAQDIIYLNTGDKFEALVKELNVVSIKYKNFANQDGPTYVIKKSDVLFIEYQNGTIEIINRNPVSVAPANTETVAPKREIKPKGPYDLHYMNRNCIYVNGLALVNSDLALIYDREIAKSRLSLVLLGAYNFNIHTNYTNRYIQALHNSKKNYDIGAGINYYTQTRKKTQYFVGFLLKYMNYEYVRETPVDETINGIVYHITKQENVNNYQIAGMLVNGLQFRITPFFTYRAFIGLGFTNKDSDISKAVSENLTQKARSYGKAYLGMCVGYRFY